MSRYGDGERAYKQECLYEEAKGFLKICSVADLLDVITDVIRDMREAE